MMKLFALLGLSSTLTVINRSGVTVTRNFCISHDKLLGIHGTHV